MKPIDQIVRVRRGARPLRVVADEIGISFPTLSRIEGGEPPNLETFAKICRWAELNPAEILEINTIDDQNPSYSRGFSVIALENPRVPENIGSVLRAAFVYNASMVVVGTTKPVSERFLNGKTGTVKASRHMPVLVKSDIFAALPFDTVPVAVEILPDADLLPVFEHPERAFYVFGPENGSINDEIAAACCRKVQIPTKFCMNLAATVNVVLYDRMVKRGS